MFHSAKSLRTPSNMFIVNLAICDFIMMSKTPVFIYNSFLRGFALGIMGCKIYGILGTVSDFSINGCERLIIKIFLSNS